MEHSTTDADGAAWFLAAMQDSDQPEPKDETPPDVIIAVSLDELDGMTGDMLV